MSVTPASGDGTTPQPELLLIPVDTPDATTAQDAASDANTTGPRVVAASQVLEELDGILRVDESSLDLATAALDEADGLLWLPADTLGQSGGAEKSISHPQMVRVSKARPLIMTEAPTLKAATNVQQGALLFADVCTF